MTKRVELCTKLFERRIYALSATASEYSEVILIAMTKTQGVSRKGCLVGPSTELIARGNHMSQTREEIKKKML